MKDYATLVHIIKAWSKQTPNSSFFKLYNCMTTYFNTLSSCLEILYNQIINTKNTHERRR